jgi:hypothetical protein
MVTMAACVPQFSSEKMPGNAQKNTLPGKPEDRTDRPENRKVA